MKKFFNEFKTFINRGNVVDLAVAVVMGSAFTAIVNSIVSDLLMPLISLCTGGIDFSAMKISLGTGEDAAAFTYGNFINAVLQFLAIALILFFIVKGINKVRSLTEKPAAPAAPKPTCPYCLEEVKEGATRCPHCAGVFDAPAKAPEPEAPAEEAAQA